MALKAQIQALKLKVRSNAQIVGAAAVPALRKALRGKNQEIRALAQEVLERIHSGGQENEGKREIHDS